MQTKWWRSGFFYLLLLAVVLALVFAFMPGEGPTELSLPEFIERAKPTIENGEELPPQIDTIRQSGDTVEGLKDDKVTITAAFIGDTNALRDYLEK